jgi:pilus assembly protein CpaB
LRRRTLTVALAGMLALIGAVAVLAYVRQANSRAVDGLKAETVLAATGAIRAGTSLETAQHDHLLTTEKVPVASLSTAAVQSVTAANAHLVMSANVATGQVLLQNMLASTASVTAGGGFVIPTGMVAVTVNMCVSEAVADYVTPGSYVAVFDTVVSAQASQVQRSCDTAHVAINGGVIRNTQGAATLLVLEKAEVLAVGQNPVAQSSSGNNSTAVTADPSSSSSSSQDEVLVTLAVNQADAERLILIDEVGLPYMALLGSNSNTAFTPPVNLFRQQP